MTRLLTEASLEFVNSPLIASKDEEKRVFFDASALLVTGETVSAATIKVYQLPDETDVTSTIVVALSETVVTTGVYVTLHDVVRAIHYRVEVRVTTAYNKHEGFLMLHGADLVPIS